MPGIFKIWHHILLLKHTTNKWNLFLSFFLHHVLYALTPWNNSYSKTEDYVQCMWSLYPKIKETSKIQKKVFFVFANFNKEIQLCSSTFLMLCFFCAPPPFVEVYWTNFREIYWVRDNKIKQLKLYLTSLQLVLE